MLAFSILDIDFFHEFTLKTIFQIEMIYFNDFTFQLLLLLLLLMMDDLWVLAMKGDDVHENVIWICW